MQILEIIQKTGNYYQKKASTNGGEYKGPCPWCGGNDRFTIWPNWRNPKSVGRYICRQCKKTGDSIEFLKDFHGMTYKQACVELGVQPNIKYKPFKPSILETANDQNQQNQNWAPRETENPSDLWNQKASAFLFQSYKYLLSSNGKSIRQYLNSRGISNETIKKARLGYNQSSITFDRSSWGLPVEKAKSGKQKSIWIPEGIIIPYFENTKLVRLRVRQAHPITPDRYILIPGSEIVYMTFSPIINTLPFILVESELDAILINQEASGLVNVVAIGNAQTRPDRKSHDLIKESDIILSLDNDDAGYTEIKWWNQNYPKSKPWIVPIGKDPGEAWQQGLNIHDWIQSGINKLNYDDDNKSIVQSKIKKCLHNKYCPHLTFEKSDIFEFDQMTCLISNRSVFQFSHCPKDFWKRWTDGVVTEIIIMPGTKR